MEICKEQKENLYFDGKYVSKVITMGTKILVTTYFGGVIKGNEVKEWMELLNI